MKSTQLLFALFILGCSPPPCEPVRTPPAGTQAANPPLLAVARHENRLIFYPASEVNWKVLVDLSIFDGFSPGMSFDAAEEKFGEPKQRPATSTVNAWNYSRPKGIVQISLDEQSSFPLILPKVWFLRGFPSDASPESLFHPVVLRYLSSASDRVEVVIMNNCGYPGIETYLEDSRIHHLTWLNNTGSR